MRPPMDDPEAPMAGLSALRDVAPPPALVPAVMQRIAEPRPFSLWRWLRRPRRLEVRVSPLGALLLAGAAGLVLAVASLLPAPDPIAVAPAPPAAVPREVVLVRFVLSARGARSVSLAGDFNAWDPQQTVLVDQDGQGSFVATVPVPRGHHEYMFLVDGVWMTDPAAAETRPDGFGRTNAVLRL